MLSLARDCVLRYSSARGSGALLPVIGIFSTIAEVAVEHFSTMNGIMV